MCLLLETINISEGNALHLNYHQQRVNRSLRCLFGIQNLFLLEELINIPEQMKSGNWKCRFLYDNQRFSVNFEPYQITDIKTLKLIFNENIEYSYKYASRQAIDTLYKQKQYADDIIIIKNNRITDTSFANICLKKKGQWFTPVYPLLNGSCRQRLIDEKRIQEADIQVKDIFSFEKIMLINAMRDFDENRTTFIDTTSILL